MVYLTEASVLDTAAVMALVMVGVITWDRAAVTVLVTLGALARCGNSQRGSGSRTTSEA
jgi:hypothetical protein